MSGVPAGYTVITPIHIQSSTTNTPNGVATAIVVLGSDDNLYYYQIDVPSLTPDKITLQPWRRLPPILVLTDSGEYPFPSDAGGNMVNIPYTTFKTQGQ